MNSWCTANDVIARVEANPPVDLAQEYADFATSILYDMSGRRFIGSATVVVTMQVDRRGYVKLNDWQPVTSITSVTVNGVAVTAALSPGGTRLVFDETYAYQMADITLVTGQAPPASASTATAALAADLLRGDPRYTNLTGATDTRQQSRVRSVSRQGVTYSFVDPITLQEKGMTGIQDVDLFLQAVNPNGMRYQPKVVTAT